MLSRCVFVAAIAAMLSSVAQAAVTISAATTANMDCTGAVCSATAADAVLNVADLNTLLAGSSVTVVAGSVAQDIVVAAGLGWTNSNTLTLDAYRTIRLTKPVSVRGTGGLTLTTNDGGAGGTLSFGAKGRVRFWDLSSPLIVDGKPYRLVGSIADLAARIAADPRGAYALADDYDASLDGGYSRTPILTEFAGTFEGLGNAISNLAIYDTIDNDVALFSSLNARAVVRDLGIVNANIFSENSFFQLVGVLAASNDGTIVQCYATGAVRTDVFATIGGLVGLSYGTIERSYANVFVSGAESAEAGGLAGNAHGRISDSYALGRVIAGDNANVGGLVGYSWARIRNSYATGNVSAGASSTVGGLLGITYATTTHSYYDIDTSQASKGSGYGDSSGITALGTVDLQAALPAGFDPAIWDVNPKYNGNFPYLIANPSRKTASAARRTGVHR